MNITEEIKKIISGDITENEEEKIKYTRDTSIFEMMPEVVVHPKDAQDIKNLVKFVTEHKKNNPNLSLTCRSAGTCMSGGTLTESIQLEFTKYMNHIKSIGDDYAVAEPGIYYRDFEKRTLEEKNLYFPSYPASRELCAVGGIVNNNSGGEKTLIYGKTNKWVRQIRVVLADGNEYVLEKISKAELEKKMTMQNFEGDLYRNVFNLITKNQELLKKSHIDVTKNSSGYNLWDIWDGENFDLTQVFCGAQGTLGIMLDAKLGLVKKASHEKLYIAFFKNVNQLPEFTKKILELKPTSLELTDDHTFKLYLKFAREMAEILGSGGLLKTIKLFTPETLLVLKHGIPKFVALIEFEGNDEHELNQKIKEVAKIIKEQKIVGHYCKTKLEREKYWKLRRDTFKLFREKIKDKHSVPFVDDVCVKPEFLPEFIPKMQEILDRNKILYTISGHLGDGNLHAIPLMDLSDPKNREKIYSVADEIYELTSKYKGTYTAEHNDGLMRGPYLEEEYGKEMLQVFRELKNIFDPLNIFNPHKKSDATFEYAKRYMITDKQFVQHHPHRKNK